MISANRLAAPSNSVFFLAICSPDPPNITACHTRGKVQGFRPQPKSNGGDLSTDEGRADASAEIASIHRRCVVFLGQYFWRYSLFFRGHTNEGAILLLGCDIDFLRSDLLADEGDESDEPPQQYSCDRRDSDRSRPVYSRALGLFVGLASSRDAAWKASREDYPK